MLRSSTLLLVFALTGGALFAQPWRFGGRFTINNVELVPTPETSLFTADFGMELTYEPVKPLRLSAGLTLASRGGGLNGFSYTRFNYLQVPVMARVRWKHLFVGAGPYAAWALGGYEKVWNVTGWTQASSSKRSLKIGNGPDDDLSPFDAGWRMEIGVMPRSWWQLMIGYERGLVNVSPNSENASGQFNRVWSVGAAVYTDKSFKKTGER